ncbi:GL17826 [Drosophila persimilis]|uniref:GL17826 n=1 Tax=Drosophila persimilis TaxID=7234 RepID=B4H2A1_DROPE|nr:GL17826 [Drosophila persimilis]
MQHSTQMGKEYSGGGPGTGDWGPATVEARGANSTEETLFKNPEVFPHSPSPPSPPTHQSRACINSNVQLMVSRAKSSVPYPQAPVSEAGPPCSPI